MLPGIYGHLLEVKTPAVSSARDAVNGKLTICNDCNNGGVYAWEVRITDITLFIQVRCVLYYSWVRCSLPVRVSSARYLDSSPRTFLSVWAPVVIFCRSLCLWGLFPAKVSNRVNSLTTSATVAGLALLVPPKSSYVRRRHVTRGNRIHRKQNDHATRPFLGVR